MLAAARLGDKVTHTSQLGGLIGGMIVGALVGAALVAGTIATVLTGGLALGPILLIAGAVCTGAAVGGGIGRLLGGEHRSVKGKINSGAATVFINSLGLPAARACVDTASCSDHPLKKLIATGATTVFIEGYPAARVKDVGECSFEIGEGSGNVFMGEETGQCAGVDISPEVPEWLEIFHHAVGIIGALCLLGPAYGVRVALVSIIGGELGGRLGGQLGSKYGGKWGGVFGSLLGGFIGGGIPLNPRAASFINRLEASPNALGSNLGNLRLRPIAREATFGESASTNYKQTFFEAHPGTEGKVVVHHAVEQQTLTRYPGVVSESEMHSLENLRGIPKEINSDVHLSQIRKSWNQFYRETPNPTQAQLLEHATKIDNQFGHLFNPPVR
jgi:uncharacterized Zn-binding protein involved in type VI secretion